MSSDQVESIDRWNEVPLDRAVLLEKFDSETSEKFNLEQGYLFYGSKSVVDPAKPQVGDLRIRFEAVDPTEVSLLGQQLASSIGPFQTSNGETIKMLMVGQRSSAEMFEALKRQNSVLAMILRVVGWVLSIVGFAMIAGPLKTLGDVIPFLGNLVGAATFFIALILGSCLSLLAISISWIAVRPVFSIGLLACVAVGFYVLLRRRSKVPDKPNDLPLATFADN